MRIVILLTVIVSMVTTYLTVRQSMKRGMMPAATPDNPMGQSQKYMAYIMPFFALSGLYWPFGLVLYWVTTNLWTLGQQYVLFMRYPQPLPAGPAGTVPAVGTVPPKLALRPPAEANGSAGPAAGAGSGGRGRGSDQPSAGKPSAGKPSAGKPSAAAGGDKKPGRAPRQPSAGKPASGAAGAAANGKDSGSGGGVLRRLGKGRAEPEPAPETPEVKLVRQQRQRQSRSKRSGKR